MHTDPSEGETEKVGTNALVTPTDEHRSGNLEDAKDRQSSSKTVIRKHWLWCAAVCVVCLFAFLQFLVIYCYKHDAGTNAGKKAGADMPALYPALQQEPDSLTTSQAMKVFLSLIHI